MLVPLESEKQNANVAYQAVACLGSPFYDDCPVYLYYTTPTSVRRMGLNTERDGIIFLCSFRRLLSAIMNLFLYYSFEEGLCARVDLQDHCFDPMPLFWTSKPSTKCNTFHF